MEMPAVNMPTLKVGNQEMLNVKHTLEDANHDDA